MFLHTQARGSPRRQGYIQPHIMQHQTQEDQNPQSATHSGRRKNFI